jgi:hypothetical protein
MFYLASYFGLSLFVSSFFMVERTVLGGILLGFWDLVVWGIAVFIVLARLGYELELNIVKGYYRSGAGAGLLVAICGLAVGVLLVVLSFIGGVVMVPISGLLLGLCIVFSSDFFRVNRKPFFLRLLVGGLIIGLLVELAAFFV